MSILSSEPTPAEVYGTNGTAASRDSDWPMPQFQDNLGDHPMWQEFPDALAASRQADIAEANRLADLELADGAQLKRFE